MDEPAGPRFRRIPADQHLRQSHRTAQHPELSAALPVHGNAISGLHLERLVYVSQSILTPVDISTATLDSTANNQRYFPYFQNQTVTNREVGGAENGQLVTTSATSYVYDQYGNAKNVATTVTDNDPNSPCRAAVDHDHSDYHGNGYRLNWCLTLSTEVQVTNTAPGSSITRTTTFGTPLDYVNCRPISKTGEPNSPYYALTQSYGYDQFGNLSDVTVSGVGVSSRNTHIDWGTSGQLPMAVTNALGQTTTYNYDFNLASKTLQRDPNGVSTSWIDDNFGRKSSETRPDGTSTVWEYAGCSPCLTGPHGLTITEIVYGKGGFEETDGEVFTDQLERPLVSNRRILTANVYVRHELRYDSLGRVVRRAIPCTWSAYNAPCPDPEWTTTSYDVLNRVTQVQRPISASNQSLQTTIIQYAGRTVTTIDPQQKRSIKVMTVAGMVGRSQDHDGYYQSFTYDAFGSLVSVTDSLSNALFAANYDYGLSAFQRDATDMDLDVSTAAGQHRHYSYDALGELTSWSDAKGQNFTESYDALSRPLVRTEPDLTTTWTWGTGTISGQPAYNIGRLQSVAANSYSESYTYDALGRLSSQSVTIPSDGTYEYDWTYDPTYGHVGTLTYPTSTSSYRLKLQYGYQNGFLQSIADSNGGTVYWQADATSLRNQVTQEHSATVW